MPKITLPNLGKAAAFGVILVVAGGLALRYGNGVPLIEDARKGFNGDGVGLFN